MRRDAASGKQRQAEEVAMAKAEAKKKREGGCAEGAKAATGVVKNVIAGCIAVWLYFMDLITDYQVTMLLTWDSVGPHTPEGRGFDFFTFAQPLPYVAPLVDVTARRAERRAKAASAKKRAEEMESCRRRC